MATDETRTEIVVKDLESKQSILLQYLGDVQVRNDEEQKNAEDLHIAAKGAIKQAETIRKSITVDMDTAKRKVMDLFRPYIDRLQSGVLVIDKALARYHAQVVAQQEEERNLRLAEEAARMAELQTEAKETGEVVEIQPMPDLVAEPAKTHRTNLGSVTYREDIDVAIVNANLVPRDLCEPSLRKIKARAESGVTDIPGVVITKKYIMSGRHS